MPVGVLVNATAIFVGGILGALLGKRIPQRVNLALTGVFGLCAMTIGISLIVELSFLSVVVMAIIVGDLIGELLNLEHTLSQELNRLAGKLPGASLSAEQLDNVISMIILFCFSGTGLFGAMNSGISGDQTILIAKAIMDFFTAVIFGATSGYLVGAIAVPQMCIGTVLFFLGSILVPMLDEAMIGDFKAVGGIITLAVGLKIAKIRTFAVINMVPALVLVFFLSYAWERLPL